MPYSKDSRRRHAKPALQSNPLAPPSALSLLSSSTSGSNSTVIPKRPFQSSLRPSRRYDRSPMEMKVPDAVTQLRKGGTQVHVARGNLNVFSYMDNDEEEEEEVKGKETEKGNDHGSSSSSSSSEEEEDEDEEDDDDDDDITEDTPDEDASTTSTSPKEEPPMPPMPGQIPLETSPMEEVQHNWRKGKVREGSLHSDSGISVRSSSPEQPSSPVMRHAYPNVRALSSTDKSAPAPAQPGRHAVPRSTQSSGPRGAAYPRDWSANIDPDGRPEEYYLPARPTVTQRVHASKPAPKEMPRRPSKQLVRNRSHQPVPTAHPNRPGYDVLASVIHSQGDAYLKPVYRKFETLNTRILLYLQDEISEMEIELQQLDQAIAREDQARGKNYASRRAELRLPSQLHWLRMELIGRCHAKVEQYNRALASYSNLTKNLEPASHADIHVYREWIAEHRPIIEQEAAFLNHELDLVTVSARANGASTHLQSGNRTELETPVIIVAFTLVSTIIVFKFVPRFLARVVISAMVGVASLCMLSPAVLNDFQSIKHWRRGITMYSAVMIVLAIVVN